MHEMPEKDKSVCLFSALPYINFMLLNAILSERKKVLFIFHSLIALNVILYIDILCTG